MKTLLAALCLCVTAASSAAGQAADSEVRSRLSQSAAQDLEKSVRELNELREKISAEKLPMSQELTKAEERLTQLRRDYDKVSRLVDAGKLEIATIKENMKHRQEELTYVGNLLDEYARTFESKVNVCELQRCGQAIETAKQASENKTLSMSEKFSRQTSFIDLSINRLFDAIGGMRFDGVGVDMQGGVANGKFALIGPIALFLAADAGGKPAAATSSSAAGAPAPVVAGLAIPQSGSANPLIRPLEGTMQAGLASLVQSGEGSLPLDPSRGGALKKLVQQTNLIHIFKKGGPIMWPLLIASVLALGTVLERLLFLMREKMRRSHKALARFFTAVTKGDLDEAIAISSKTKFYVVRALGYALKHKEQSLPSALLYAQAQELKRFQRGIAILDTVITLAPLLGLLGTVTGMMGSFSLIGGELSAPGAITGGIAEALIATAFGLGIAITALLPFNFLNARIEDARHEIESASTQLELLVQPHAGIPVMPASVPAASRAKAPANAAPRNHGLEGDPEVVTTKAHHRAAAAAASEDVHRRQRELQREQAAIQRQIAELQAVLDEERSGRLASPESNTKE